MLFIVIGKDKDLYSCIDTQNKCSIHYHAYAYVHVRYYFCIKDKEKNGISKQLHKTHNKY